MSHGLENMNENLTLVLGGAASGKSAFAEALVQRIGGKQIYLATAQAFDDEMTRKISDHVARRGAGWHTIEAPFDLSDALLARSTEEVVLLDCATLWLTNHLLADHDLAAQQSALIAALHACPCPVVIVSNEVGQGGVPENALARRFQSAQGRLNQALAAQASCAVFVTAGLPQILKGRLPA